MKKLLLSLLFSVFALFTLQATAQSFGAKASPAAAQGTEPSFGLGATVGWTVYTQGTTQSTIKTNKTSASTTTTTSSSSLDPSTIYLNATFLALLANSFHTNLPAGAQLASDGYSSLYVVDKTGKIILLNVSAVFYASPSNQVQMTSDTDTLTVTTKTTTSTGKYTDTGYTFETYTYDDSALTTTDGTHTVFQLSGVANFTDSGSFSTISQSFSQAFTFNGAGTGMIRGKNCVITKATISGSMTSSYTFSGTAGVSLPTLK